MSFNRSARSGRSVMLKTGAGCRHPNRCRHRKTLHEHRRDHGHWSSKAGALLASKDADLPAVLESHLAPRWQALQGRASAQPSLRQLGRNWVERLAWQAQEWGRIHNPRHMERRIKSFSGRSMGEWQSLVRTEELFFVARDRYETGQPFAWAALAQDAGFSDQAHMSRMAKRITGFSPSKFAQRFIDDESFWMYRLWV